MAANSQILGLKELSKKLDAMADLDRGRTLRKAGNAAGTFVVNKARSNASQLRATDPHKTFTSKKARRHPQGRWVSPGFFERSIKKTTKLSRDKRAIFVRIGVTPEAFYGVQFLELGTSKISATPWLTPALRDSENQIMGIFRQKLLDNINKIAKKK